MTRRSPTFTLIEMMVVLAIIGILAGILLPSLIGAREQTRRKSCLNNLSQIGRACISYQAPNGDYFPAFEQAIYYGTTPPIAANLPAAGQQGADGAFQPMPSLACLYPTYLPDVRVFGCPSTADVPQIAIQYYNIPLSGTALHTCFGFIPTPGNPTVNVIGTTYNGKVYDPAAYTTQELLGIDPTYEIVYPPPPSPPSLKPPYPSTPRYKCSYLYDELMQPRDLSADQAIASDADGQTWTQANGQRPPYPAGWQRWPAKPNHDNGQNVLYLDGHVKWSDANYCSHDPTDNIFSPQYDFSSPQPTPNPDVDAYLWDGASGDARGQSQ